MSKRDNDYKKIQQETVLFSTETLTIEQVDSIFQSLISVILQNYQKGISTYIPFIGDLNITYIKDKTTKKGITGEIKINIKPDSFIEHEVCVLEKEEDDDQLYIISNTSNKIKKTLERHQGL